MNSADVTTNLISNWLIEPNCLPTRVVMWHDRAANSAPMYRTHLEVKNEDGSHSFILGHYDMTLNAAMDDFRARCDLYGIIDQTFADDNP